MLLSARQVLANKKWGIEGNWRVSLGSKMGQGMGFKGRLFPLVQNDQLRCVHCDVHSRMVYVVRLAGESLHQKWEN